MTKKHWRIFALPAHTFIDRTSGVDFLRVIQPMKYLNGYKDKDVEFEVRVFDHAKDGSFDWVEVFTQYDAVFFNYTTNAAGFAVMGCLAQKYKKKLICDLDDDLFNILQDNPAREVFGKGKEGLHVVKSILGAVDHVTCTNDHLKHSIMHNTKAKGVTSLPNYVDLSVYTHKTEVKDRGIYKALHFGSTTHFSSLSSEAFSAALTRIMLEYPNFSLTTVGAFLPEFRKRWGSRYQEGYGSPDIHEWIKIQPKYIDDADFLLVPLDNNLYNKSKSSTKYLEASSFGIAGCWQNIRQYQELVKHGENGYLCSKEDEWYTCIKNLIHDADLRRKMGDKAFETIQDWTIQKNVYKYADMLKKVLTQDKATIL